MIIAALKPFNQMIKEFGWLVLHHIALLLRWQLKEVGEVVFRGFLNKQLFVCLFSHIFLKSST